MSDEQTIIEELVQRCLREMQVDGQAAIERICEAHPERAERLRRALRALGRVGLLAEGRDAAEPVVGDSFGDYRLLKLLARGGMGEVHLAEQVSLGRKVALKLVHGSFAASQTARDRFRREIDMVSKLDHVGICPVFDAGEVEGVLYLAMRYVEGETLATRIARTRREAQASKGASVAASSSDTGTGSGALFEVLALIESVARALHYSHEVGLVHRDVKPANIMITPDGEPVLLDFGLARQDAADHEILTMSGDQLGTPSYMAPEQVSGRIVDRRTDVYGLGATLYAALTLRAPHEAVSREALFHEILYGKVSRASGINRSIPRDVEVVLETALDPDPARRFQTALDFADDLRRVQEHTPILARRLPVVLRVRRWTQRNRAAAVAMALLGVGLVIALVFVQQMRESGRMRTAAIKEYNAVALALEANRALGRDHTRGLLLALEAVALDENRETVSVLHQAYAHSRELRAFEHSSAVRAVCFSPDGEQVLTGCDLVARPGSSSRPATAQLWDVEGGLKWQYPKDGAPPQKRWFTCQAVSFSPNGRVLTGWYDFEVRAEKRKSALKIHDRASGRPLVTIESDGGPLAHARFVGENRALTAEGLVRNRWSPGLSESRVTLWDLATRKHVWQEKVRGEVVDLDVSSSGNVLLGCSDKKVRLLSSLGQSIREFSHDVPVLSVAFDPSGDKFATSARVGIRIYSIDDADPIRSIPSPDAVISVCFSPCGQYLLTGNNDQVVRLLDETGQTLLDFRGHGSQVLRAVFDTEGTRIASISSDKTARVWDLQIPGVPVLFGHGTQIRSAAFDPSVPGSQARIVTASYDGDARVFDPSGKLLHVLRGGHELETAVFSPDGKHVATGENAVRGNAPGTRLHLWNLGQGDKQTFKNAGRGPVYSIDFSRDGRFVVCGAIFEGSVLELATGELRPIDYGGSTVRSVQFSGDEEARAILLTHGFGRISLIDRMSLKSRILLERFLFGNLAYAAWSKDGDRIVAAHGDGKVRVLMPKGDRLTLEHSLGDLGGSVAMAEFSSPGDRIVAAYGDGMARVWDASGKLTARLGAHRGAIATARFSSDGERIVTASGDRTARVWIADTAELRRLAEVRRCRTFTLDEWSRYRHLLPESANPSKNP